MTDDHLIEQRRAAQRRRMPGWLVLALCAGLVVFLLWRLW